MNSTIRSRTIMPTWHGCPSGAPTPRCPRCKRGSCEVRDHVRRASEHTAHVPERSASATFPFINDDRGRAQRPSGTPATQSEHLQEGQPSAAVFGIGCRTPYRPARGRSGARSPVSRSRGEDRGRESQSRRYAAATQDLQPPPPCCRPGTCGGVPGSWEPRRGKGWHPGSK